MSDPHHPPTQSPLLGPGPAPFVRGLVVGQATGLTTRSPEEAWGRAGCAAASKARVVVVVVAPRVVFLSFPSRRLDAATTRVYVWSFFFLSQIGTGCAAQPLSAFVARAPLGHRSVFFSRPWYRPRPLFFFPFFWLHGSSRSRVRGTASSSMACNGGGRKNRGLLGYPSHSSFVGYYKRAFGLALWATLGAIGSEHWCTAAHINRAFDNDDTRP